MAARPRDLARVIYRWREGLGLIALLLVGLGLRLYQVDWDQGHLYHPDERYILMTTAGLSLPWPPDWSLLLSPRSPLDPHGFAYGSFAFYLLRLLSVLLTTLGSLFPGLEFLRQLSDLANLRLIGRPVSALFDTGSIAVIYLIGRRLYGRWVAFLAASFVALSVLNIQLSHFYATDTIMTFFVLATILAAISLMRTGSTRAAILAGICLGLALGTKVSAAPVAAVVVVAVALHFCCVEDSAGTACWRLPEPAALREAVRLLVLAFAAAGAAFLIVEPYAVIDVGSFVQGVSEQGSMVRGIADLPYTRQFIGRPPYLYFLQNLVLFGVGIPLGGAMIVGLLYALARVVTRPRPGDLLLLSFVIPYFAITGAFYAKFMRYLLPITPLLALFAALALVRGIESAREWRRAASEPATGWGERDDLPELVPDEATDLDDLRSLDGPEPVPEGIELETIEEAALALPPEAVRFARLKGLSLDLFLTAAEPADLEMGRDGKTAVDSIGSAVAPVRSCLPSWVRDFPAVAWLVSSGVLEGVLCAVLVITVGFSAFYALALDHMYASPTTPVEGSLWLYRHAPEGAVIATEHWEEGMPVPIATAAGVESAESHHFTIVTMPMYDDDTPAKLDTIVNNLEAADYIVFFSNRLYGTIPRLPERYPMSRRYYELLFGEKLGFTLVAAFERYPNLLGIAFADDTLRDPGLPVPPLLRALRPAPVIIDLGHADESFSVYDHQRVLIFQKTRRLSPTELRNLIGPAPAPGQTAPAPAYKSLLLTPAQEALVRTGGTFRDLFDRASIVNHYPLLTWIVLIILVSAAGIPMGFAVFRFLPDRGWLVSRTLGILVLTWLDWIVVSLGFTEATRPATLALFAAYLLIGLGVLVWRGREIQGFIRRNSSLLLFEEGLFWAAFFYDVYIRSLDPDLWHPTLGGEKPMDLAYFTAAARSPIYPPYDPWFAGGYLNYYYFGQIIVGTLTRISGVLPTTSYNIVVPLLFALTVGGVFTVGLTLAARPGPGGRRVGITAGLFAALLVCVVGNLGGFIQVVDEIAAPRGEAAVGGMNALDVLGRLVDGIAALVSGQQAFVLPQDWYWGSTRALALLNLPGTGSINEFPYFTFLFADLHAHLIALPLTLLVMALCVNVIKAGPALAWPRLPAPAAGIMAAPIRPRSAVGAGEPQAVGASALIALVLSAALTIGALYPTNTWDFPTYLGLFAVSLLIPVYLAPVVRGERILARLGVLAVTVALARVLYQPFYAAFQSFYSGVHPSDEKSAVVWFLVINGLFVAIMLGYLLVEGADRYRRSALLRSARLYITRWELAPRIAALQARLVGPWSDREVLVLYAAAVTVVIAAGAVLLGMALTGLLIILLALTLLVGLHRGRTPEECLVTLLFATGLALAIGTEQLTIDGDVGRMNTVFKFYEQIWVLWGTASGVAAVWTWRRLGAIAHDSYVRLVWAAIIGILVLMAAIYPVLGTISRVSNRFDPTIPPTLDGTAFMDTAVYVDDGKPLQLRTDKEAIIWLQDHVTGTPVILEGVRPLYRWGSRISVYTGLPTVIGWDWHQKQQRWGYQDQVDQRLADVARMYDDPSVSATVALLRQYRVGYIIDGQLEQAFYPAARAKFDSMVGTYLSIVYDRDGVRIYQVH
ncbi:MAG TPA: DUF2298 domain-containing protein [Chloroflexota bacterium]|nr:DUF2298 domain-containing protein [Chloroflexota bacterium]